VREDDMWNEPSVPTEDESFLEQWHLCVWRNYAFPNSTVRFIWYNKNSFLWISWQFENEKKYSR
jgi:hypothetical protein